MNRKVKHRYTIYELQSIIPAVGWQAIYAYEHGGKCAHAEPLTAWGLVKATDVALYEDGGETRDPAIMEMQGYGVAENLHIEAVVETSNCIGYLPPGGSIDAWEKDAREYCEKEKEKEGRLRDRFYPPWP